MRKYISCVLVLLMVLSILPLTALAEAKLGDVLYGPWSEWTQQLPIHAADLAVETREGTQRVIKDIYTYRRYEYFNLAKNMWYATSTDKPGTMEKPGSGRWVERSFDEKLDQVGIVNLAKCYDGQWFFESVKTQDLGNETITEYRYRTKSIIKCVLTEHSAAIARGATYQLQCEVLQGEKVWYRSSNTAIATVDAQGLVRARDIGNCEINVMMGNTRVESLQLAVGEQIKGLENGSYSVQLVGTDEYLAPIGGVPRQGASLFTANYIPAEQRYFKFLGAAENAFRVRITSPQMLYLSVRKKDGVVGLSGRSDTLGQVFSILRLKGGQDLIHLTDDPTRFLAVSRTGKLEMRPFEALSTTIRWKLSKEGDELKAPEVWDVPYQRDGRSYSSQGYQAGLHNGFDVGSYGNRVPALAVASGMVIQTFDGCVHDYGKQTEENGRQIDPCGGDRSYGNIVVIQHSNGLRTAYAHLSRVLVKKGDRVNQGDMVGMTGSTGSSTAVHLHLEVRDSAGNTLDPAKFIQFPKIVLDP